MFARREMGKGLSYVKKVSRINCENVLVLVIEHIQIENPKKMFLD